MKTAFYALLIALLLISCEAKQENDNSNENSNDNEIVQKEDSPDDLRQSLQRKEAGNPCAYMSYSFVQKAPSAGGAYLKGTLRNNASVVTFRDAVIEVKYLNEADSVIGKSLFTCYKMFQPNSTIDFNIDLNTDISKVKEIQAEVIKATPAL